MTSNKGKNYKKYYDTHREAVNAQRRKYYAEHKEEFNSRQIEYYAKHKKEICARQTKYQREHPAAQRGCQARYRAGHKQEVARRSRERQLMKKYGLSPEDYNKMVTLQKGLCAICKHPPNKGNLFIDHNHSTGKVRGLLCHKCNIALGHVDNSVATLRAVIKYLAGDTK